MRLPSYPYRVTSLILLLILLITPLPLTISSTPTSEFNTLTIESVVSSLPPKKIKRLLSKRHAYTPAMLDKLNDKKLLVAELVGREMEFGGESFRFDDVGFYESIDGRYKGGNGKSKKKEFNRRSDHLSGEDRYIQSHRLSLFLTTLFESHTPFMSSSLPLPSDKSITITILVILLTITTTLYTPFLPSFLSTPLLSYKKTIRKTYTLLMKHTSNSSLSKLLNITKILALLAIDFTQQWLSISLPLSYLHYVIPSYAYNHLRILLFPFWMLPNLSVNPFDLATAGGGKGGTGFGFNLMPLILRWVLSYLRRSVKGFIEGRIEKGVSDGIGCDDSESGRFDFKSKSKSKSNLRKDKKENEDEDEKEEEATEKSNSEVPMSDWGLNGDNGYEDVYDADDDYDGKYAKRFDFQIDEKDEEGRENDFEDLD